MNHIACAFALVLASTYPALATLTFEKVGDPATVLTIPEDTTAQIKSRGEVLINGYTSPVDGDGLQLDPDAASPCPPVKIILFKETAEVIGLEGPHGAKAEGTCTFDTLNGYYQLKR